MKTKPARVSPPASSPFVRRLVAWTVRPVAFAAGLVAMLWRRRARSGQTGADATTKATRLSRREEKRRRKELARAAAKTHHGRRRAA